MNIEEKCILMSQDGAGATQVYYLRGPRSKTKKEELHIYRRASLRVCCSVVRVERICVGWPTYRVTSSNSTRERSKQPLAFSGHDKELIHNTTQRHNTPHQTPDPLSPDHASCEDTIEIRISLIVSRKEQDIHFTDPLDFCLAVRQGLPTEILKS